MVRTTCAHVMRAASGGSCNSGERSVLAGEGRARTCCCCCSSMSTWLTPLRELGSVRDADLEQRWGRLKQGAEHRPQCGFPMY